MYRRTGIDAAERPKSSQVLAGAVAGGPTRPGSSSRKHCGRRLRADGLGLAYLIMHAEISGVLVSGSAGAEPGRRVEADLCPL